MRARRADDSCSGFTLIEVLASVAITSIALISITSLFNSSHMAQARARATTDATIHAAARLEELIALPSDSSQLYPGTTLESLDGGYVRETSIVANQPAPDAKTITVIVRRGRSNRSVELIAVRPR